MKIKGERCDSAPCPNVRVFDIGETKPYGWIQLNAHYVGFGGSPLLPPDEADSKPPTLFFCSKDCLLKELDQRMSR